MRDGGPAADAFRGGAARLVVCDHCTPPTLGALYEAFDAAWARQLVQRLALRSTPTHGSGFHSAENALRALTRPCVPHRRCGDTQPLAAASVAWSTLRHEKQRGVDWPCNIDPTHQTEVPLP